MDVAGLSTALSNVRLQTEVGAAMLSKAMDTNEELGAGLLDMMNASAMENSVTPWLGGNFDMRI